jgi:hypothetical protein
MKNITRHTGTLEIIERLKNSAFGNPRFLLRIDGITCRTAPDASLGYSVQNYDGKTVTATIGTYYGVTTVGSIKILLS